MRSHVAFGLVGLSLLLATSVAACGSGRNTAKSAGELATEWVSRWSPEARLGVKRPPDFDIPAPPAGAVTGAATQITSDVTTAAAPLAALRARVHTEELATAAEFTKETMCEWFGWYVEDVSHTVPDAGTFLFLFARAGLKVILRTPVDKQVRDAAELFRNAIMRAKNEDEQRRYFAIASVCSIPSL